MAAKIYKCSKCGEVCHEDEIDIRFDWETGATAWYCPHCGGFFTLEEAETCGYCGKEYIKDDKTIFDFGKSKICRSCIESSFRPYKAMRHICRCRDCMGEFVLRATDTLDELSAPTQKMIDVTGQFAEEVITRYDLNPPWQQSDLYRHFVECLKETCVGKDADIEHYLAAISSSNIGG